MAFAGLNMLAILIATVASFTAGAVWYWAFSGPWRRANDAASSNRGDGGGSTPFPFILAFLAELVMAWTLAGVVGHLGEVSVRTGLISAGFIWFGFVITALAVNDSFSRRNPILTLIDGGHWLVVLATMGLVIGLFGS